MDRLGIVQFCFILFILLNLSLNNESSSKYTRHENKRVLVVDNALSLPEDWGYESNFSTTRHYLLL